MDSEIMVESLPLLGVCNLCLSEGAVRSMYLAERQQDSYVDMLRKCFSIDMSQVKLGDMKHLICECCAARLRDCSAFREQAETSLKTLERTVNVCKLEDITGVKWEGSGDVGLGDVGLGDVALDDDDDEDNMVLKDIAIKREHLSPINEHPKKVKRLVRSGRSKSNKTNKLTRSSEIDSMLASGLFPFKIRNNRRFSCAICPETSFNLDDIRDHIKQHTKPNIQIGFKKMLFSNSQRFYKNSTSLRCKVCTTDVSNYEELKKHVESCVRLKNTYKWNNLPFKLEKDRLDCPVCNKMFLNFVSLNTHMNTHYPNFICENCGKAFASKARLRGHMRTHEVGSFPCRYCNAVFDRVTKRENHVSKEHKAGIRYACKRCNLTMTSFYARQKHLAEAHNEELKRYKCKVCPQSYITPGHLSSHVRRDHLNERNHKCDKCDLAFYTKNALKMHMIKHDGERIHTCNVCQKSYQRKKTLREHMRIHNNDKRFVCPVCGRAFTQKCTLKGHLKVHDRKIDLDDAMAEPVSCRIIRLNFPSE